MKKFKFLYGEGLNVELIGAFLVT